MPRRSVQAAAPVVTTLLQRFMLHQARLTMVPTATPHCCWASVARLVPRTSPQAVTSSSRAVRLTDPVPPSAVSAAVMGRDAFGDGVGLQLGALERAVQSFR